MRRRVSHSEVITTAVVLCLYFGSYQDKARLSMELPAESEVFYGGCDYQTEFMEKPDLIYLW